MPAPFRLILPWKHTPPEIVAEALSCGAVEREEDEEHGTVRYLLRLGSRAYPHVKLALEQCSGCDEFVLSVDTHDRHFVLPSTVGEETRRRFEAIQRLNCELKRSIETDWNQAGLPTFRRYIEEGLAASK